MSQVYRAHSPAQVLGEAVVIALTGTCVAHTILHRGDF